MVGESFNFFIFFADDLKSFLKFFFPPFYLFFKFLCMDRLKLALKFLNSFTFLPQFFCQYPILFSHFISLLLFGVRVSTPNRSWRSRIKIFSHELRLPTLFSFQFLLTEGVLNVSVRATSTPFLRSYSCIFLTQLYDFLIFPGIFRVDFDIVGGQSKVWKGII